MTTPEEEARYARRAAKLLVRGAAEDGAASALPDRAASIAAIERALRARGRRRLAPWLGWGVAAAAAAALVLISWRSLRPTEPAIGPRRAHADALARAAATATPSLTVAAVEGTGAAFETADGRRRAASGDRIGAGAEVRVPDSGHLLLALDTGTRLRIGASSRVYLTSLGASQRFEIESGSLEAEVAKVPLGGRFVVATGDAEVEVKGTRFEVVVLPTPSTCAPFVRTQVMVQEGVVAVRFAGGEVQLTAGSAWPRCPVSTPAVHNARPRARVARPAVSSRDFASIAPAPPDRSTLAEQNDLLAAALSARRRGDLGEAIQWLDRLIARYPDGQLIGAARAERAQVIEAGGAKGPPE
jgi:hypothetical protein